ncbi:MAG: MoaD/ThiS family protein [Desulfohalobiaceae bacterium]
MHKIEIQTYGSLQQELKDALSVLRELPAKDELSLSDLLNELNIPQDRVQLVMLNNRPVRMDARVRTGDRVALFPREYPVFADWKDYRSA